MQVGIHADLQRPVGTELYWWKYDSVNTVVDSIYDTGASTGGKRWIAPPFTIPVVTAIIYQGQTVQNERGFYQSDVLRLTVAEREAEIYFPDLIKNNSSDSLFKDRIVYQNEVWIPTRFYLRGQIQSIYTLLTIDLNQVNPEELINDPQFLQYAPITYSLNDTYQDSYTDTYG